MSQARSSGDRPPTAEERYMSAMRGSNLRVLSDRVTDADAILAAAFAASRDERASLALAVYGVIATTDMRGAKSVADAMARSLHRRNIDRNGISGIKRVQAFDLAMNLLKLWHKRTCPECSGRGHPLMDEAPVQDESIDCAHCNGTGQIPLERLFKPEQVEHARWMENEINSLCSFVFSEMAKLLSSRMNF